MTLRQLEYLIATVDHGGFGRAAAHMGLAQPSLSQQIRALEDELGVGLLERLSRGIRLTPAGEAFIGEARAAVLSAQRAARSARAVAELERGELDVLAIMSAAIGILPELLNEWHQRHPRVAIRLHEFIHTALLRESLLSGVGELAVGPRFDAWTGPTVFLGWEEFAVILPARDPLADAEHVPIRALADREWVLFDPDNTLSEVIATVCGRAGYQPRGAVRTSQVSAASRLAGVGLGVTIVPKDVVREASGAAVRQLDPPVAREVVAHARSAWSAPAQAYVDLLHTHAWPRTPPAGAVLV